MSEDLDAMLARHDAEEAAEDAEDAAEEAARGASAQPLPRDLRGMSAKAYAVEMCADLVAEVARTKAEIIARYGWDSPHVAEADAALQDAVAEFREAAAVVRRDLATAARRAA